MIRRLGRLKGFDALIFIEIINTICATMSFNLFRETFSLKMEILSNFCNLTVVFLQKTITYYVPFVV